MPEMTMTVRWPDASTTDLYSPSLVLHDHLETGRGYAVSDFLARAETALAEASERVRARYGFACTSAAATIEQIRAAVAGFAPEQTVLVLAMQPPLPKETP